MISALGAAATFAAMVVTPLARPGGTVRRRAATVVVGGLAATTFDRLRVRYGPTRAVSSSAALVALGWAAEAVGTRTGRPFGRYRYAGRLRPEVGGVPILVPLAWFAMAAPAREVAHAVLGRHATPSRRMALGAAALTAWDLFLDPQMTAEGYWRWERAGRYRGIPLSNFVGWMLVSGAAMGVLEAVAPPTAAAATDAATDTATDAVTADVGLVGEYAGVAAMETLGHAVFFRDRTVALAGGLAMVPVATLALQRVIRGSTRSGRVSWAG